MNAALKQRLLLLKQDNLIINSVIVFIGFGFSQFVHLLYHLVSIRLLTPQEYGVFNTLSSVVFIFMLTTSPIYITLIRFFTEYVTKNDFNSLSQLFTLVVKKILLIGSAIFVVLLITSPLTANYLKTQFYYVIICSGIIALSIFSLPFLSMIQSFQRFTSTSFIWGVSSLMKFILGALLMLLGLKVVGALSGYFIGPVLVVLLSLHFFPKSIKMRSHGNHNNSASVNIVQLYKFALPAFIAMLSFAIMTHIDVVLVKHFFSPFQAGYYSIAQIGAKIALLLPATIAVVLRPKSTEVHVNKKNSIKLLYRSLFLVVLCNFLLTGIAFFFPKAILTVLSGSANAISCSLFVLFVVSMGFFALLWIVINYALSTHNFTFIIPLCILAIVELTCIYLFHPTLLSVVRLLLLFSISSFIITSSTVIVTTNRRYKICHSQIHE